MHWSSQKGLEVLIIGTNVMHHLSVRPLYVRKFEKFLIQVSILHQACCARTTVKRHWVDIIKVCLKNGANVNEVDCIGQTPLFYAISHCQAIEIVPLLIEAGK